MRLCEYFYVKFLCGVGRSIAVPPVSPCQLWKKNQLKLFPFFLCIFPWKILIGYVDAVSSRITAGMSVGKVQITLRKSWLFSLHRDRGLQCTRLWSGGSSWLHSLPHPQPVPPHILAGQHGPGREENQRPWAAERGSTRLRSNPRRHIGHCWAW